MAGRWNITDLGKTWPTLSRAVQDSLRAQGVEPPAPASSRRAVAGYAPLDPESRQHVRVRLQAVRVLLAAGERDAAMVHILALLEVL